MMAEKYSANNICEATKQITNKNKRPTADTIYHYIQKNNKGCNSVLLKAELEALRSKKII